MARRRQQREFGPGPYLRGFARDPTHWGSGFPWDLPAIDQIERVTLDAPIVLLAGENGTGKSTLVEAIAEAVGFDPHGGELERAGELPAVPRPALGSSLVPLLSETKPRNGYFLRAESFFDVARSIDGGGTFAPDVSLYGGVPLHEQSHGQSFLALAANRFGGEGLYVLDEPEAALSISGALALLSIVVRAARAGAQFVIATHSPVLLATPGAVIYELDEDGIAPCPYDALEPVRTMRAFLDGPDRFVRAALQELGDDA